MELTKEDKILLAATEDKINQCIRQYRLTYTNFLDLRQRSLVQNMWKEMKFSQSDVRMEFYGGYEDAERTVAVFLPDYADISQCPLSAIRIRATEGGKQLTHRDYLGSITGLGIKREMTGDILTTENGADVIVLEDISDFILMNYDKAGRTSLKTEAIGIDEVFVPEKKSTMIRDTVASLRLDNIISSAFQLSRAKAVEAIKSGLVYVNSMQMEKPDIQVTEDSKLVLRGRGKAYLREVGKKTRKDRISIIIERYL